MWDLTIYTPSGPYVLADIHSLFQSMWDPPIHPLRSPASLLAHCLVSTLLLSSASLLVHRPMSGSDTICNSPSPPLADIDHFGLSLKVFKTLLLGRGFHTLIKNVSFSSPTDVESHNIFADTSFLSYKVVYFVFIGNINHSLMYRNEVQKIPYWIIRIH